MLFRSPWQEAWAGREGQAKSRDGPLASSGRPAAGSRASQQWRTDIADCLHDPHTFSADYTPANVFSQPTSTLESLQRNATSALTDSPKARKSGPVSSYDAFMNYGGFSSLSGTPGAQATAGKGKERKPGSGGKQNARQAKAKKQKTGEKQGGSIER